MTDDPQRGSRTLTPLALGLASGCGLAVVSLVLTVGFGWAGSPFGLEFWRGPRGWFDIVLSGLFGWAIGGASALLQGARRDLVALRPALRRGGTPNDGHDRHDSDVLPRRSRVGVAVGGIAVGLALNFSPGNWPDGFPGVRDPFFLWATLRTVAVSWAVLRTGVIATRLAIHFSRLGPALHVDDLLDLRPLAPLGRCGLRNVAVWVGISVFFGVMLIAPFGRSVAAANLVISIGVGLAAFLGPVRGAHTRLVEARDAELSRIRAVLRTRVARSQAPADGPFAGLSLADLLAWEARIDRVRTWPFDTSTLLRFSFYVAIGLGSWVGAALVERALGAVIG